VLFPARIAKNPEQWVPVMQWIIIAERIIRKLLIMLNLILKFLLFQRGAPVKVKKGNMMKIPEEVFDDSLFEKKIKLQSLKVEEDQYTLLYMWIKQGVISKKEFIYLIERINHD
jgi:hypothetical protein